MHGIILEESSDVKQLLDILCMLVVSLVEANYLKLECLEVHLSCEECHFLTKQLHLVFQQVEVLLLKVLLECVMGLFKGAKFIKDLFDFVQLAC